MLNGHQDHAVNRFERKYRCNYRQYLSIKQAVYPYIQKDHFTRKAPGHRYLVRSLYFDTAEYQLFFEKGGGNTDRIKYRIRTYGDQETSRPDVRVEMKVRNGNLSAKYGTYITIDECDRFIKSRHWSNYSDPVLCEFERRVHLLNMFPKSLVEYRREGYQTIDGNGIRITFDHRIKSASARTLFPEVVFWHIHHEQLIVLEIKHSGVIPDWLNKAIKNNGLCLVANSKFAFGIQGSQADLITPGWSDG